MHSLTGTINTKGDVRSCDSKVLESTYYDREWDRLNNYN